MKEGTKSKARRSRPRAVKDRNCDVHIGGESICIYPLDDLLHDLSRRWTLLIIAVLGNGPARFNEIQANLAGVSSRTLSARLKNLEQRGLIDRDVSADVPPRVEYSLTPKGESLLEAMGPLLKWASATRDGSPGEREE